MLLTSIPSMATMPIACQSPRYHLLQLSADSFEGAADAVEDLVKGIAEVARVVEHAADTIADSAEEAQGLLTKLTGDKSDEIADLARAIERAADTLADTAEDTGALLDKVSLPMLLLHIVYALQAQCTY